MNWLLGFLTLVNVALLLCSRLLTNKARELLEKAENILQRAEKMDEKEGE